MQQKKKTKPRSRSGTLHDVRPSPWTWGILKISVARHKLIKTFVSIAHKRPPVPNELWEAAFHNPPLFSWHVTGSRFHPLHERAFFYTSRSELNQIGSSWTSSIKQITADSLLHFYHWAANQIPASHDVCLYVGDPTSPHQPPPGLWKVVPNWHFHLGSIYIISSLLMHGFKTCASVTPSAG